MTEIVRRRRERHNTTAGWAASTTPLLGSELGHDTDTGEWRTGPGLWADCVRLDAVEVAARQAAITAEANARTAAISAETTARNAAIAVETAARQAAITGLSSVYRSKSVLIKAEDLEPGVGGSGGLAGLAVPHFDPVDPTNIYHGAFWPITPVNLGPFLWEAWVRFDGGEYWISEGFGGAHAILAGFAGGSGVPTGNVWNGTTSTSFGGAYTAQVGEWLRYTVIWDGTTIWVLINGIVVGTYAFAGPRRAQYGDLFIGGTDHSNLKGAVAQVRAWEGQNPITIPWHGYNFPVERYFGDRIKSDGAVCQFLANYIGGSDNYPDMSGGFMGERHPGVARGKYNGFGPSVGPVPHPQLVLDPTAPFGNQKEVARTRTFQTPVAAPAGAKIWDSFGRPDRIPMFTQNTTMGSTEGGSLGVKTWEHDLGMWGVFDGAGVGLDFYRFARVANDSADMDVRVGRFLDAAKGFYYGSAAARIRADRTSGWRVYATSAADVRLERPNGTIAGSWTASNASWSTLRLVASGTTFTVYVNTTGGGWEQLGQVTGETANQTEVGAGLYHYYGIGSQARYTDFEVR